MTSKPVTRSQSVAPPPLGDAAHLQASASGSQRHNGPRPTAVKSARRNTKIVRSLRLVLPSLSVGLLGFYAFGLVQNLGLASTERANAPKFTFDGPIISRSGLGMVAPRYEGFNKDGSRYVVKAKRAVTDLRVKGPVKLEAIDGRLFQIDQSVVRLEATRGTFNQTSNMLTLRDGILIRSSEGMTARLVSADVNPKSGKIKTAEPVEVQLPTGVIVSRAMDIDQKDRIITFKDGVRATLKPGSRSASLGGADTLQSLQLSGAAADGRPAQPIVISARSLKIEDGTKRATFIGPVQAAQGATKLTADQLLIDYTVAAPTDGQQPNGTAPTAGNYNPLGAAAGGAGQLKALVASGNVIIVQDGRTTRAPRVQFKTDSGVAVLSGGVRIDEADGRNVQAAEATLDQKAQTAKLTGGVIIRQGNGQSVRARSASLDQKAQRATLIGDVRISGGNNQGAVAAQADLDQAAQRAVLTGRVRVTQGRNTLSGDRLVADQARGTLSMTGTGNGRISARFFREQASQSAAQASSQAARSNTSGGVPGFNFRTDPTAPILIDAQRLDVDDNKKVAVFRGATRARQGAFTIRSKVLTATYTGSTAVIATELTPGTNRAATKPTRRTQRPPTELRGIEATGGVTIVSEGGAQKATGDKATYDVAANEVRLSGNVVLRQGRQVIRGTLLRIDVTTGLSRFTANTVAAGGQQKKGRMRMVIFPSDLQNAQRNRKQSGSARSGTSPSQTPTASGWSSTTQR